MNKSKFLFIADLFSKKKNCFTKIKSVVVCAYYMRYIAQSNLLFLSYKSYNYLKILQFDNRPQHSVVNVV